MNEHKQLIAWLNDAYSMERSLNKVLENHSKDADAFPEEQARARGGCNLA
jgi:ferritin-like metal-binding protein YciE